MSPSTNPITLLCAQGMEHEAAHPDKAMELFRRAWNEAATDLEKATAAHYVARHQPSAADKLTWDVVALRHALASDSEDAKTFLPSLYLNVAKGYEDTAALPEAAEHYQLARARAAVLPDDGYGAMIRKGIAAGLQRVG